MTVIFCKLIEIHCNDRFMHHINFEKVIINGNLTLMLYFKLTTCM